MNNSSGNNNCQLLSNPAQANNNNHVQPPHVQFFNHQSFALHPSYGIPTNITNNNDNNDNHELRGSVAKRSRTSRSKKPGLNLHEMTPQQKNELKKQYLIWTQQAIKQMQVTSSD